MADRRTLDSAAKAVHDKLETAKIEYETVVGELDTARTNMALARERVAILSDAYELIKPKVRVRNKAAKVLAGAER